MATPLVLPGPKVLLESSAMHEDGDDESKFLPDRFNESVRSVATVKVYISR